MTRTLTALAAAALGLSLLAGCGGGDGKASGGSTGGGDYCKDLAAAKQQVDALKGNDFSQLDKTVKAMHELAAEAPASIEDDWKTLVAGVDKLVAALDKAGLDDDDMAALQSGQVPEGVDMSSLQTLVTEIQALDTDAFQQASEAINKNAKDKCGVDLSA